MFASDLYIFVKVIPVNSMIFLIKTRAGGHDSIPLKPDPQGGLKGIKVSPSNYMKKKTGNGGTMV